MSAAGYLRGSHAELGDMYAAFDARARHVEPSVRSGRFAARLAPFPTREEAERALIAEGAVIEAGPIDAKAGGAK